VEEQAPAVLAQKRLAGAEGLIGIREAAKRLGWPPKAFVALMVAGEHLFHEGGKLQARADHLAAGRFQMVTGVKEIAEGRDHEYGQAKFTAAGLEYFSRKMPTYIALPKKLRKSRTKKKETA
jgi:phage antirepressor YoqD-like protein